MSLTVVDLQKKLQAAGFYAGLIDGDFGKKSRAALDKAMTAPWIRLGSADIADAAAMLNLTPAHVGAVYDVESAGFGFDPITRKPIIRFEAHHFQKRTDGRFDASHPRLSHRYSQRKRFPQPASQEARWAAFMVAVSLDPAAAFASASFGLFQVMGFNHALAGFPDIWDFVLAHAKSEREQLMAFCRFIHAIGQADELRRGDWAAFAAAYNGPAYDDAPGRDNDYDTKLARRYRARGGK